MHWSCINFQSSFYYQLTVNVWMWGKKNCNHKTTSFIIMVILVRKYVLDWNCSFYTFTLTLNSSNCDQVMILNRTYKCQLCWMWCVEVCKACKFMNNVISNLSGYDWNMRISHTLKIHQYHMFGFCKISFTMFLLPRSECRLSVYV